ncbi:helix-turn-helix domain-containing protein [bacterium]|nr:helix-turn-helix domain-containing protein [bacterium]
MSSNNLNKIHVFGKQLKILMQEVGIKQRELAKLAGMHESNISRLAGGTSTPTLEFILLIVENYNVSLNWLLLGVGPMLLSEINSSDIQDGFKIFVTGALKDVHEEIQAMKHVMREKGLLI